MDRELFPEVDAILERLEKAHSEGRCYVGTCNDACYLAPYTDIVYAGDRKWIKYHIQALFDFGAKKHPRPVNASNGYIDPDDFEFCNFSKAEFWTKDAGAVEMYPQWQRVYQEKFTGLCTQWPQIAHGGNSGHQLINLAYHFGAGRGGPILLLGYDCKNKNSNPKEVQKNHFFGNHPTGWGNANGVIDWRFFFKGIAKGLKKRGVQVVNCSLDTAIECFPRGKLEDYL